MTHALVLLCGGLSTRMGTNKAFLPFGEYTLMEYQFGVFARILKKYIYPFRKMTDFLDAACCQTELHSHS